MAINKKSSQTTKPERLIVSELPEAERAIAKAGTPMNKYYQAAVLAEKEE